MADFFRNKDLGNLKKFFVKNDMSEIVTDISTLHNEPLSKGIYHCPTNCPLVNVSDQTDGSCFDNYFVPSGAFRFYKTVNGYRSEKEEKNLPLEKYIDLIFEEIVANVVDFYELHNEVVFSYSGGIDSLVILAILMSKNLLSRTHIVSFENHSQSHESTMHLNLPQKERVLALHDSLRGKVLSVEYFAVTLEDVAFSFNYGKFEHMKSYASIALLKRYKNCAIIGGYHGNAILLHKATMYDEIILSSSNGYQSVANLKDSAIDYYYNQSLINYDLNKKMVPLSNLHLVCWVYRPLKEYKFNNNDFYSPMGTDYCCELFRKVDYSTVSARVVADVHVAREVIHRLVGTQIDYLIGVESPRDSDSLTDIMMPLSLLDTMKLYVPSNLNHNDIGLRWITREIVKAKETGVIPINSMVSIKMLHWLSEITAIN